MPDCDWRRFCDCNECRPDRSCDLCGKSLQLVYETDREGCGSWAYVSCGCKFNDKKPTAESKATSKKKPHMLSGKSITGYSFRSESGVGDIGEHDCLPQSGFVFSDRSTCKIHVSKHANKNGGVVGNCHVHRAKLSG